MIYSAEFYDTLSVLTNVSHRKELASCSISNNGVLGTVKLIAEMQFSYEESELTFVVERNGEVILFSLELYDAVSCYVDAKHGLEKGVDVS